MKDLSMLGSKIENLSQPTLLLICFCGIFLSFFLPRLVHKYLNFYYSINAPIFLTFLQFFAVSILSAPSLHQTIFSRKKISTHLFIYIITSIALLLSMILDNYSVHLLLDKGANSNYFIIDNSFAIESLFKSPKILPVMVGNIVFLKKKFSFTTVISICIMVCGFVGIALGDLNGAMPIYNDNYNYLGIVSIVASMTLEAIAANLEEYILAYCNSTQSEAISIIFSFGAIFTFIWSAAKGEISKTIMQIIEIGKESKKQQLLALGYLLVYAFMGAIGIHFVFLSLKSFGSLQTVALTSLRKVFNSCLLYFFMNNKQITIWYSLSLFFSFGGYAINIYNTFLSPKKIKSGYNSFINSNVVSSSGGSGGTRNLNDISDLNGSNDYSSPNYSIVNNANDVDLENVLNFKTNKDNQISNEYDLLSNSSPLVFGTSAKMNVP